MAYQIIGGQLVDVQTGQVMSQADLENELYMQQLAQGGQVGQMQIVGYVGEQPVYAEEEVGQLGRTFQLSPQQIAAFSRPGIAAPAARRMPFGLSPQLTQRLLMPRSGPTPAGVAPALAAAAPGPVDLSPLGIDSQVAIAAGVVLVIPTILQTIFRPERLSIGASVAPFFTITQLTLGNTPLTANTSEFAAETFADDAVGANMRKITGTPGQTVFVGVRNEDANARRFRATLFGASSQPEGCRT
jgi:hypothetical protein